MFPVMQSAGKANGYAFVLMLVVMCIYSLPKVIDFYQKETELVALFFDGELARKFEKAYDREFVLREPSIQWWANVQYGIFGEAHSGASIGDDGWMFTYEEFIHQDDLQAAVDEQVVMIESVQAELAEQGKRLIIVPVPMKLDIYAEHAGRPLSAPHFQLYDHFVSALGERGVEHAPLREAFLGQKQDVLLFLKRDTHWTPNGARLAAQRVAEQFPELVAEEAFVSTRTGEKPFRGDLMNYVRFSEWMAPEYHTAETIDVFETVRGEEASSEAALFDEATPAIALVGSSYTRMDDWNFTGFLKEHLKSDIVPVAIESKGPVFAMQRFLESDLAKDAEVRTVLWEFPVRTLIARTAESG